MRNSDVRAKWIKRGEVVKVGGVSLLGGLVYVGKTFGLNSTWPDRYLINPSLPVSTKAPFVNARRRSESCSYEALSSDDRRGYLEWLAGACRMVDIPDFYIQLYMSGLYHRVLIEQGADTPNLILECRRLLKIHKENKLFSRLVLDLIALGSVFVDKKSSEIEVDRDWLLSEQPTSAISYRVGYNMLTGQNIQSTLAFAFALDLVKTEIYCPDIKIMKVLWDKKYKERFPQGFVAAPDSHKLSIDFLMPDGLKRVKSQPQGWSALVPDPRKNEILCRALSGMMTDCVSELAPLFKYRGRQNSFSPTFDIVSILPKQMIDTIYAGRFAQLKQALDNQLSKQGVADVTLGNLAKFLELKPVDGKHKLPAKTVKLLGIALDKMDIGYEPDTRYGNPIPTLETSLVFFQASDGGALPPGPLYVTYKTLADLVSLAAKNEEDWSKALKVLARMQSDESTLSSLEKERLSAYSVYLDRNRLSQAIGRPKLAKIGDSVQELLDQRATALVLSLNSNGLGNLAKTIQRSLGRTVSAPTHEHMGMADPSNDDDDLITAYQGESFVSVAIPKHLEIEPSGAGYEAEVTLNLDKLAAVEQETEEVSSLLSSIFVDENVEIANAIISSERRGLMGLDEPHSQLLIEVMKYGNVSYEIFESLARQKGLLANGAVETINEASFDIFGSPILIDNDAIIFDEQLSDEIKTIEASND